MLKKLNCLGLGMLLLFTGCTSGPQPAAEAQPPEWVLKRPADDADFAYFTASGTSETGELTEARDLAAGNLYADILRLLGIRVTSSISATAQSNLEDFKADITQSVTQTGKARVVGLEIMEIWQDTRSAPRLTVHLLARYAQAELLKEKQRLEALFKETVDSVAIPEQEGDILKAQNRYYEAAVKYIEAAGAAARNKELDNREVKFKRNLDKAVTVIEAINLIKVKDNLTGTIAQKMEDFQIKVAAGNLLDAPPVPNATIAVTYTMYDSDMGKMKYRDTAIKSDENGLARFARPVPLFAGTASVKFTLDISPHLKAFESIDKQYKDQLRTLEQIAIKKTVSINYSVANPAAQLNTGVVVIEFNEKKEIVGSFTAAPVLIKELDGFKVKVLPFGAADWQGKSEQEIINALVKAHKGSLQRLIIGFVYLRSQTPDSGLIKATAEASLQIIDLTTDTVLQAITRTKTAIGKNAAEAISSVFKELGRVLGVEVRNSVW